MGPKRAPGGPRRGPGRPTEAQKGAKGLPGMPKGAQRVPRKALQGHFALLWAREKQVTPTGRPNRT